MNEPDRLKTTTREDSLFLKQPTDKTCVHTCLAMIVGESVDYVIDYLSNDGPLCAEDMIIFLAHHGIYLSFFAQARSGQTLNLQGDDLLEVQLPLRDRPALITVRSERFLGKLHQCFWDGRNVQDPNPLVQGPRGLKSYDIVEFWPLLLTEQRFAAVENAWRSYD